MSCWSLEGTRPVSSSTRRYLRCPAVNVTRPWALGAFATLAPWRSTGATDRACRARTGGGSRARWRRGSTRWWRSSPTRSPRRPSRPSGFTRADGLPPRTRTLSIWPQQLDAPEAIMSAARLLNPLYSATRYPDVANGNPAKNYDEAIAAVLSRGRRRSTRGAHAACRAEARRSRGARGHPRRRSPFSPNAPSPSWAPRRCSCSAHVPAMTGGGAATATSSPSPRASKTWDRGQRYNVLYDLWEGPVDIEPITLTPAEFDRSASRSGIVAMASTVGWSSLPESS